MPRQEVAFLKKSRKIKGCGSLEGDFYTRFKPKNKGFWAVTWWNINERCELRKLVLLHITKER